MKAIKFLALMLVALVGMTACSSDDEEKKPEPIIDPVVDPEISIEPMEDVQGYIFVTSRFFTNSYYGNDATIDLANEDDQWNLTFHDPQWGEGTFENVEVDMEQGTLSGTGTIEMANNHSGTTSSYDATFTGDKNSFTFTVQLGSMGTTTIYFQVGEAPLACQLDGKHKGTNSVMVGNTYGPYEVETTYTISANPDGTINISMPEYQLEDLPVMGDMTIGKLTISNIAYEEEKGAFYRTYGADGLTQHCTTTTFDRDFAIAEASYIQIELTEAGVKVTNSFSLGNMPFPIFATFEETVSSAK